MPGPLLKPAKSGRLAVEVNNMIKKSNIEAFLALSDEEKEAEVARALRATPRPLTPEERQRWERLQKGLQRTHRRKKLGRPAKGKGVKVISLSVEQDLLKRADAEARRRNISRAALVAEGLEAVLSK